MSIAISLTYRRMSRISTHVVHVSHPPQGCAGESDSPAAKKATSASATPCSSDNTVSPSAPSCPAGSAASWPCPRRPRRMCSFWQLGLAGLRSGARHRCCGRRGWPCQGCGARVWVPWCGGCGWVVRWGRVGTRLGGWWGSVGGRVGGRGCEGSVRVMQCLRLADLTLVCRGYVECGVEWSGWRVLKGLRVSRGLGCAARQQRAGEDAGGG